MLWITGALIWEGLGMSPRLANLSIGDGCIKGIWEPQAQPPEGITTTIEADGHTVIPGLYDLHTHITLDASSDINERVRTLGTLGMTIRAVTHARQYLTAGVIGIRDLGGLGGADLAIRQAINDKVIPGPRMLASGQALTMTGGHGHFFAREVDGADEALKGARAQLKAGVDVVKIMATGGVLTPGVEPGSPQLEYAEMAAIIHEAHKAGKTTAAHAQGTEGIKNCLRAGIDSIEHGIFLDDEAIEIMLAQDTLYVPTLAAPHLIVKHGLSAGIPAYAVEKAERVYDSHRDSVCRAHQAGVRIGVGTDAGTPFNHHGAVTTEIRLLKELGLPLDQVLHGATALAAAVCGHQNRGTIAVGQLADLVMIRGNPWEHLHALEDIDRVFMQGNQVYP